MTSKLEFRISFLLEPENNQRLNNLCGPYSQNLKRLEKHFNVEINNKSHQFYIDSANEQISNQVKLFILSLYNQADNTLMIEDTLQSLSQTIPNVEIPPSQIQTRRKTITASNPRQQQLLDALNNETINFAVGPAGTGKTYLGVAKAVEALENAHVNRLIFVRPAVEAGERLGFLPGDMIEKVQPYLRPIYDALYDLLGNDQVQKLQQSDNIEIAPLAFMRGRTLNHAFIMLDEAQNTTISQMKMFLTRLGYGSKMVITGDMTQTDLPSGTQSGLPHAIKIMREIPGINITTFQNQDIVRHNLVSKILRAYDQGNK